MVLTDILPDVEEEITESDGKAHLVRTKALMTGGVVVALCGKRWIPVEIANAASLPKCQTCQELMKTFNELFGNDERFTDL